MKTSTALLGALGTGVASLIVVAGCSSSGSSGRGSTAAPVQSSTQTAAVFSASADAVLSGTARIDYWLRDPSGADRDLLVRYSTDGGATWSVTTDGVGGDGRDDLAATPQGLPHVYLWNTAADVPTASSVLLQLTAVDGQGQVLGPLTVDNQPLSTAIALSRRPYVQSPTHDSAVIAWNTAAPAETVLEYGETPALGLSAGAPRARVSAHAVKLSGLKAGTRYSYRLVTNQGAPLTRRLFFETAPVGPTPFTVVAFGDSGALSLEQGEVARAMTAEDADVYLHLGDIIYPNGGAGDGFRHYQERFFDFYEDMLETRAIWPAPGNHDALAAFGPFKEAFYLPNDQDPVQGELYYSFVWGDVKFVVLETTLLHRIPLGSHMDWFRRELQTPERWKVVLAHHPLYSAGSHGNDPILQMAIEQILEDNRVDIVLGGHEHNYERIKQQRRASNDPSYKGPTYFVSGGGGTSLRGITPNGYTAVAASAHHYLRLRFDGAQCTAEAITPQGVVLDHVVIDDQ
ncbi:MAG: metallophosphoesterase [Planctomycetota bacterium]